MDKVNIPILAKLTPNVAVMSPAAEAAMRGGANGVAAMNTNKCVGCHLCVLICPQKAISSSHERIFRPKGESRNET